jgi:hypothetical protein
MVQVSVGQENGLDWGMTQFPRVETIEALDLRPDVRRRVDEKPIAIIGAEAN